MARESLKKARRDAGMTQQQVADKLEISLRYYQSTGKPRVKSKALQFRRTVQ